MVLRGRVTVAKDGQLWIVKVGGREAFIRKTKAEATRAANKVRKEQGKI